ncbi:hypothetical protein L1987_64657 [Smallanthus sonchifolius]|uniref:Uncharacterized protein n=1 Tax=Smallanthus sonchifolius TaxID=185202 RepID=A0ACB9BSC4_9ASTR|nr:hypothetical protein L1987_64657 [Smallanthus sonchifolius]
MCVILMANKSVVMKGYDRNQPGGGFLASLYEHLLPQARKDLQEALEKWIELGFYSKNYMAMVMPDSGGDGDGDGGVRRIGILLSERDNNRRRTLLSPSVSSAIKNHTQMDLQASMRLLAWDECYAELRPFVMKKMKQKILLQRIFFFVEGFPRVTDQENEDDVGRWRNALKEAADLAGMELKNTFNGHEAKFIQQIVQYISPKLHFINPRVDGKLVGMETRVKCILSSLETGSDDIQLIGIKGIGGGGKTTLARAVFDHVSIWFEGKRFVENVREVSKNSLYGLKELQKQVLKEVLNDKSIDVPSVDDGKDMIKKMMCSRKVLIVLDDVDDIEQLEALVGEPNWFKPGSIIIITTRDAQVLAANGVNIIHDVNLLTNEEAICLFSRYAFKREIPNQGYEELSKKVVKYAAGLPLTIKVLGSHLCGRSEREWVDAIERLKTIPLEKTFKRLEISYDGLENDQKEIFLDVVCLLKGMEKKKAIRILESCGFNAEIGLRVLEQKSLITISDDDEKELGMHDGIEEMGQNIVRLLHPKEPSKHSRLWIIKEIEDILVNELGTEATRSIQLSITNLCASTIMKGLTKMTELRFLYVNTYSECSLDEVGQYLPDALQYLY